MARLRWRRRVPVPTDPLLVVHGGLPTTVLEAAILRPHIIYRRVGLVVRISAVFEAHQVRISTAWNRFAAHTYDAQGRPMPGRTSYASGRDRAARCGHACSDNALLVRCAFSYPGHLYAPCL